MNKALFLDRDGVIVNYIPYLSKPEQVEIPEGAGQALREWQDAGYLLIIVTNQSGVGRGYFSLDDIAAVHGQVFIEYQQFGVSFHDVLICPHHPDEGCKCRKPSPYLLLEAAKKYNLDLCQSYFIGDAPSDLDCAIQAGCHPVLLLTGRGTSTVEEIEKYPMEVTVFQQICESIKLI